MIKGDLQSDGKLERLRTRIVQTTEQAVFEVADRVTPIMEAVVDRLQRYPPPPPRPTRYRRTGRLSRGWQRFRQVVSRRIIMAIINAVPYRRYVHGPFTPDFHLETGWIQSDPVIDEMDAQIAHEVTIGWTAVLDEFFEKV